MHLGCLAMCNSMAKHPDMLPLRGEQQATDYNPVKAYIR